MSRDDLDINRNDDDPVIREVDDTTAAQPYGDDILEMDETTRRRRAPAPQSAQALRRALVVARPLHEESAPPPKTRNLFETQQNATDDSYAAFGNQFVPPMGSSKFAPTMDEVDEKDYEAWLKSNQLSDRKQFRQHRDWQERLRTLGHLDTPPTVAYDEMPEDHISGRFRAHALHRFEQREAGHGGRKGPPNTGETEKFDSLAGDMHLPENFSATPTFVPEIFEPELVDRDARGRMWIEQYAANALQIDGALSRYQGAGFDELLLMRDRADNDTRLKASSMTVGKHRMAVGRFIVVSDHDGEVDGEKIQIWAGLKPSFTAASTSFGQRINQLKNSSEYNLDVPHLVLPNLTIIQINANEVGFCHNRRTQQIEKMLPGRYVLQKGCNFVGKAQIDYEHGQQSRVDVCKATRGNCPNKENEQFRDAWAADLSIVYVPPNHVTFIGSPKGTFVLQHKPEPYIINKREGYRFINCALLGDQVCASREENPSYFIVTLRQEGEYVIFKDGPTPIVWMYDREHPELNTLHLSNAHFTFNGRIHDNTTEHVSVDNVTVFSKRLTEIAVLQDAQRNVRFLEIAPNQPIVLRAPWVHVHMLPKSKASYAFGEEGNRVWRVQPTDSEWVAVRSRDGRFELIPPPLDGSAYYFYEPEYTVLAVINKTKEGEQRLQVPGIGEVCIVNLTTGHIGLCQIRNMNFFLNPSPEPHVFMPPDRYSSTKDVDESYIRLGDLHRIYLRPDERCVVEKNGKAILLPDRSAQDLDAEESNGVYTFRADKLVINGPVKKSTKEYKLGPLHFFNVEVGEIAYGNKDGRVCIWGQGEHYVDNNKNEWFKGFFSTNVDPVEIKNFEITSKHGITSHIDIYVTYSIDDPDLAINQFRTHEELHSFIEKTTRSEILQLCANQPPIGYTDGDFSTTQNVALRSDDRSELEAVAMQEIESKFAQHAKTLLKKYGINLGDMHITKWVIDPQFVETARSLALGLQTRRAEYEQKQIKLQEQKVENDTQVLLQDQERQRAVTAAKTQADVQSAKTIAKANEQTGIAIAEAERKTRVAKAEMETKLAEAQQRKETAVLDAETKAFSETAGDRAKADAKKATAQSELDAAKMQAEAIKTLAEAEARRIEIIGEATAKVQAADTRARFGDASGDKLVGLEEERVRAETQREVAKHTQIVTHTMSAEETRNALATQIAAVEGTRQAYGLNTPFSAANGGPAMFQPQAPSLRTSHLVQAEQLTAPQ